MGFGRSGLTGLWDVEAGADAVAGADTRAGTGIGVEGATGVGGVSTLVRNIKSLRVPVVAGVPWPDEPGSFWYPNDNCKAGVSFLIVSLSVVALASRSGNNSLFLTLHTGQQYSRDLHVNPPAMVQGRHTPWRSFFSPREYNQLRQ